jgi:hypothetical protein
MKWRTRLELGWNSLFPNKRKRWGACTTKLDEARAAIKAMESAKGRVEFEGAWSQFVDSLEKSWTAFFDEGKQISGKFQPQYGPLDKARKEDELLRYLRESRHISQHSRLELDWNELHVQIAPGYSGHIREFKGFTDGTFEFDAEPYHPEGGKNLRVVLEDGEAVLPEIVNRGIVYVPPTEHQGQPITGISPLEAARLAVNYYRQIYYEAAEKLDP